MPRFPSPNAFSLSCRANTYMPTVTFILWAVYFFSLSPFLALAYHLDTWCIARTIHPLSAHLWSDKIYVLRYRQTRCETNELRPLDVSKSIGCLANGKAMKNAERADSGADIESKSISVGVILYANGPEL